jgi:hypothetical protein
MLVHYRSNASVKWDAPVFARRIVSQSPDPADEAVRGGRQLTGGW